MNSKLAALFLASATLGAGPAIFAPPTSAHAQVEVSFDFFYDTLSPHGEWIEVGDYGMCWRPNDVGPDWAPYTDGYWTYTDAGWTWVSYEDFGAVAYHYGRWVSVEDEGWCWVPDYEWGPAWVSWRNNDNYVGWAPLPPEARWEPDRGFSVWVDTSYDIGPSYYNFCAVEDFGAPVIREVIIERPRNFFIIADTFNITNISINRSIGVPFCGGPRFDFIRGRSRRPVPTLKLVRETNITNIEKNVYINKTVNKTVINNNGGGRRGGLRAAVQGNQLIVPAPKVKRADKTQIVEKVKPSRRVAADRVNRGWKGVRDENQRREIRDRITKQTEGRRPENAPAKPIEVAELQPVPTKADPNAPSPVSGRNRNRDREDRPGRNADRPGRNADRPDRNADRPDRNANQPAEKPQRAERPEGSDRPSRPESPSRPPAEAPARGEEKKRDTPPTAGGRRDLKPFNEKREDRREERKKEDTPEVVPPPAPMVPKPQDAARENDRKRPDRDEREAQENRRQKQQQEDNDALQRSRQQRQREEQQLQDRMRQRQSDPAGQAQRDAAAGRQREADQQEMKQQQRRQQQARESEAMQRQQQQRSEENRQRQQQQRAEESRHQQMQALQRQQAAREQQQQEFRRQQQQRQAQPERQMQREMPRPQRQPQPERQAQRERPQQPQRQQFQPRPQQEQRMQQPRPGGGGGGRGEGGGRGDGGGRNRGNGQEEGRGGR